MSSIYITEPPTKGKVRENSNILIYFQSSISNNNNKSLFLEACPLLPPPLSPPLQVLLKTTLGDIDIELWSKEAPLACRNFIQLCLEEYYNDTIFHRVVFGK